MIPTFTTRWFYANLEHGRVLCGDKICCICGLPMAETFKRKNVLRSTFTDYSALRIRTGQDVCAACAWYFDRQDLRRHGWLLSSGGILQVRKSDWLPILRDHVSTCVPHDAYYLIKPIGLAGKHLALYAPLVLAGADKFRVQFDMMQVTVDNDFLHLVDAAHLLREKHSWKEIRTGDYYAKHVLDWPDIGEFVALRDIVQQWLDTAEMLLAEFLWSKERANERRRLSSRV